MISIYIYNHIQIYIYIYGIPLYIYIYTSIYIYTISIYIYIYTWYIHMNYMIHICIYVPSALVLCRWFIQVFYFLLYCMPCDSNAKSGGGGIKSYGLCMCWDHLWKYPASSLTIFNPPPTFAYTCRYKCVYMRKPSLPKLRILSDTQYIYIYIYGGPPPPKTYVFNKNTGIYSVSRTFLPVDLGSFFSGGGHISKSYMENT